METLILATAYSVARLKAETKLAKIVSTDKARQGRTGRQVLIVLISALILCAVAWMIAEFYGQAEKSDATTTSSIEIPAMPSSIAKS